MTPVKKDAKKRIAFLGPEGTHSHEACLTYYKEGFEIYPCRTAREIFWSLAPDSLSRVDEAVVPVENSTEGPVTQTLDQLARCDWVLVQAQFSLPVRQALLGSSEAPPLGRIKVVYSHPQALGQCEAWLDSNLDGAERIAMGSTADAAMRIREHKDAAAIAGEYAAKLYGLTVLAENIQDEAGNATRFLVIRKASAGPMPEAGGAGDWRSLLHIVLANRPGSLLECLQPFRAHGVNLTFIQSRPLPGKPWEYGFFLEAAEHAGGVRMKAVLAELATVTDGCRVMGVYRNETNRA
jgi:chorismate mutase/prephenate dehydratase